MDAAHATCDICRALRPVERSLYKHGWEERDAPLPRAANRLVELAITGREDERRRPRLCPLCGALYSCESRYEYLVNGSEDEEELRRLSEAEARAWLGDGLVDGLPRPLLVPLRETVVNERVAVYSTGGEDVLSAWGANAVAVLGDGETLLVDPLVAPAYARDLTWLLAARRAGRVATVVATHHHSDHSVGASVFTARGAEFVAHAAAAARMAAEQPALLEERRARPELRWLFADAVPAAPTRTVTAPLELSVGGLRAVVRPCGPAHTPGDLRVDLPDLGVVVAGDLLFHGYHPNLEHADLEGWRRALEELLEEPPGTTFVPGHGAPGGREIVEAQLAWFDAADEAVRAAERDGGGASGAVARLRSLYPGWRLEAALPAAVRALAGR